MKAKELIKILKHDPEAEVIVTTEILRWGITRLPYNHIKLVSGK